ncbi:energy-coupling factor ABC transporter ATP-binding protein [Desulforamulus aquiferis]|uniref:ABC transporter ATP-binding protein n=1 Tax=Desulforamulus aquiferis TaxID=1397668 RepID=A0AAW7ZG54_9FIRM|nr:ABC transporter ATP-binding protein [Desulforamulus aquiferis]MDO7788174.1 ABC transporter ATP-binding protein [Desulforamulus aquiferis]
MSREVIYHLEDVSFHYDMGEVALQDIELDIYSGEKVVLLGANGCGKSTLLKVMAGLQIPQKGKIWAFGEKLNEENVSREDFSNWFRSRVSFVFQNSEVQLFNSTVWEEIAFGPLQMNLGENVIRQRVKDVIELLSLQNITDRPPYKLSGGEKKKVALASVLSINPQVVLLDEPTNGLDPRSQRWLINLLYQLNKAGKTLITATHNLDIVEEIADRVLVFSEDHQLVASGTPKEILSNGKLLIDVNLVDEHFHCHIHEGHHRHYHAHD